VVALSADSGSSKWQTTVAASGGVGSPSLDGGQVFVATGLDDGSPDDRAIAAIDLATGARGWRWRSPEGAFAGTPALYEGTAFVVSEASFVAALDAETGRERWRTTLDAPVEALPAVAGHSLIVAENRSDLLSIATEDGSVLWRVPLKGVPYAPVVSCGVVLVPSNLGTLTAYAAP
jgi:outer membrane protein assembly factor BamB